MSCFILLLLVSAVFSWNLCCPRGGDAPVEWTCGDNCPVGTYNYVPSFMLEATTYRLWWCGGYHGDSVFYATSNNLDSNWPHPSTPVFGPSHTPYQFDEQGSCDPSVIKFPDGTLYLYYGGIGRYHASDGYWETAIGVAKSTNNGSSWSRLNGGNPVIVTSGNKRGNLYGAGQPSVVNIGGLGGYNYMIYTDTGGNDPSGVADCIYLARSTDPSFGSGIEYWQGFGSGFASHGKSNHALCCLCASGDLIYWDSKRVWVLLASIDGDNPPGYGVWTFDANFNSKVAYNFFTGPHVDGPGVLKSPLGHGIDSSGQLLLDLMRGVGDRAVISGWKLAHMGANLVN
jgi:hypothetical protein